MIQSTIDNIRELLNLCAIKGFLAGFSAWGLSMVGHPDSAAVMLFYLLICDLALGISRSWKSDTFRGSRIVKGAFKFFRYWLVVAVFVLVDGAVTKAFPYIPVSICDAFIAYLAINEAFSCVDHLAFFGMPVPEAFLNRLRNYREACLAGKWTGEDRRQKDALTDFADQYSTVQDER